MKIGITGGHSELLYDMIKLFTRLGHEVVSIGGMPDHKRDQLENCSHKRHIHEIIEKEILKYIDKFDDNHPPYITGNPERNQPPIYDWMVDVGLEDAIREMSEEIDVFYGYIPRYVGIYYKHKPMIWQFIGGEHGTYRDAARMICAEGGRVVCHSENNAYLLNNEFPTIHFHKDPDEWCGWNGDVESVFYVANALTFRSEACHMETFLKTRIENKWFLGGSQNDDYGPRAKEYPYDEYKQMMRDCRIFYNLGTAPVPYTLSPIEAAMTGMPVLTDMYVHYPVNILPQYQLPELLGEGCLITNNKIKIRTLLKTKWGLKRMSGKARDNAIHHFGIENVSKKWNNLLNGMNI